MTTFTEALIQIVPDIRTGTAADVRSSLIGLARQLQQDPESQTHSLQTWWQWLDDEGYDRETFATILSQICKVRIGEQSLNELTSYIKSSKDNSDGIAILLEQVKQSHPSLLEEVETLESLALEEENQLGATAGGMGKGGEIGTIVGVVGVAGIIGGVIWYKATRKNKPDTIAHAIERETVRESEEGEHDVTDAYHQTIVEHEHFFKEERTQAEKEIITAYKDKEIIAKAESCAKAHSERFKKEVDEHIKKELRHSYLNQRVYEPEIVKYDKEKGSKILEDLADDRWGRIKESPVYIARKAELVKEIENSSDDRGFSKWISTDEGMKAEEWARERYESGIKHGYEKILKVERDSRKFDIAQGVREIEREANTLANTEVHEAIVEIDALGTEIRLDIEEHATDAKNKFDKKAGNFFAEEERKARQIENYAKSKAEREAEDAVIEADKTAKAAIRDGGRAI